MSTQTLTAGTTPELCERAVRWAAMLAAALKRGDYSGAQGYARHLDSMAGELRSRVTTNGSTIRAMVETGEEHIARERFGDAMVDAWFCADGVDPGAMRGES